MNELLSASATEIARMIRDKEVSSVEAVTANLERIGEVNDDLNAVVQLASERALAEAAERDAELARGDSRGPLHGVPFTLKDSHDTEGIVTTGGTTGRTDHVPDADSPPTARLRAAGGVLLGKTNTPELTFAGVSDNLIYGRTNNPYDLERTPGGSSGGAAAIIAACGSPFDLGSDTGGSIRGPANYCGIAGLKPTSGRVSRTGHIVSPGGYRDSFSTIGPLARRVEDLWLTFPLIAGTDGRDPYLVDMPIHDPGKVDPGSLRVAFYDDNGVRTPTEDVRTAVRTAAAALGDRGAIVTEVLPECVTKSTETLDRRGSDGGAYIRVLLERYGTSELSPIVKGILEDTSNALDVDGLARLQDDIDRLRSEMLEFIGEFDAIVCPVAAQAAQTHEDALEHRNGGYTHIYNMTGWPGAVVRVGSSADGLPIGVQIIAKPWREDVAVRLASVVEEATGGWQAPAI